MQNSRLRNVANGVKKFFSKKSSYALLALLIIITLFVTRDKAAEYEFVTATQADVVQKVSITGKTKPIQNVSLSFERTGRLSSIAVDVGEKVVPGQVLLRQDATADTLELQKAQATLVSERAVLAELRRGSRSEDIAILESKIATAAVSLEQAQQGLLDTVRDAHTKADDAVRNYADQFFDNARSSAVQINIDVPDSQLKIDLNNSRRSLEGVFSEWGPWMSTLTTEKVSDAVSKTRGYLTSAKTFLDKLSLAVNALSTNQTYTLTTINTYRSNVSTARSAVQTALSNLSNDEEALTAALSAFDLAEKNLALARAGTVAEKIAAQEARVAAQEAAVAVMRHNINTSVLRSPIAGIVIAQEGEVGEVVEANNVVVTVSSDAGLEVEAFVPEVDIGAMMVGNAADVIFDAFAEETFQAKVSYIDPAETLVDGVASYKVKLLLDKTDPRLRSGMTANISVTVAEKQDVVTVPFRAVTGKNGSRFVSVQSADGSIREVPVTLGITGVRGEVEISAGLPNNAVVAIPKK